MRKFVSLRYPAEGVALVTATHASIANNCSWELLHELAAAFAEAREVGQARAAVLASGVPGHWLEHVWLQDLADTLEGASAAAPRNAIPRLVDEIRRPGMVVVAAISGDCSGGGLEVGWACDLRIAEEQVLFGQPEIDIGLTTGRGGTSRLARLIGRAATAELVMLGRPMRARRIHALGGINAVVPQGTSVATALQWAMLMASKSPLALASVKQILNDNDDLPLSTGLEREQELFSQVARTPAAIRRMREIQARYDRGETFRNVYGGPIDEA